MSLLTIDGETGEGGGQILRTALSLSAILVQPVQIVNIRAGRKQPGLRPQHVQAGRAAAAICDARTEGLREHSRELFFEPQAPPRPGNYRFEIGTAGAVALVLQTVLVPLSLADQPSRVTVGGGTHVAWSPPYHYLEAVYLPALAALGFDAEIELVKWGFYPKGGGEVRLHVRPHHPPEDISPAWCRARGELELVHILSAASNVGNQVTARQANQAYNRLVSEGLRPEAQIINPPSRGPGTCVFLTASYHGGVQAGFTGYGRLGYPAERVADDAVDSFLDYHHAGSPVDPYLADQLVLPVSTLGQPLTYETSSITQHLLTNAEVATQFLGDCFQVKGIEGGAGTVEFRGLATDGSI